MISCIQKYPHVPWILEAIAKFPFQMELPALYRRDIIPHGTAKLISLCAVFLSFLVCCSERYTLSSYPALDTHFSLSLVCWWLAAVWLGALDVILPFGLSRNNFIEATTIQCSPLRWAVMAMLGDPMKQHRHYQKVDRGKYRSLYRCLLGRFRNKSF